MTLPAEPRARDSAVQLKEGTRTAVAQSMGSACQQQAHSAQATLGTPELFAGAVLGTIIE